MGEHRGVDLSLLRGSLLHVQLVPGRHDRELIDAVLDGEWTESWSGGDVQLVETVRRLARLGFRKPDAPAGRFGAMDFVLGGVLQQGAGPGVPLAAFRVALSAAGRDRACSLLESERVATRSHTIDGVDVFVLGGLSEKRPGHRIQLAVAGDDLLVANWSEAFERVLSGPRQASEASRKARRSGPAQLLFDVDLRGLTNAALTRVLPAAVHRMFEDEGVVARLLNLGSRVSCAVRYDAVGGGSLVGSAKLPRSGNHQLGPVVERSWARLSDELLTADGEFVLTFGVDFDAHVVETRSATESASAFQFPMYARSGARKVDWSGIARLVRGPRGGFTVGLGQRNLKAESRSSRGGDDGVLWLNGGGVGRFFGHPPRRSLRKLLSRVGPRASKSKALGAFFWTVPAEQPSSDEELDLVACGAVTSAREAFYIDWVAPVTQSGRRSGRTTDQQSAGTSVSPASERGRRPR